MSNRVFAETSERYGSRFRKVVRVQCRKCGVSHPVNLETPGGFLPQFAVAKKLEKLGWVIGADDRSDYCPDHAHSIREKKSPMLKVVEQSKPSPSETPPREPTRDDRNIIHAKLAEVYLTEKNCYAAGWSDKAVAEHYDVPRKWVEEVRAAFFGDHGGNEEMAEFYGGAKALCDEARGALAEAQDYHKQVQSALSDISDRITKIEKMAEIVRKHIVT